LETLNLKSRILVFSSPSGAGKTTIVKKLYNKYNQFVISISATTRAQRPGEINGLDYFFISTKEFEKLINEKAFLEYEKVHDEYYGTLKTIVDDLIEDGKVVLFDIDVNGAQSIKKVYPDAILFFIKPPDMETLKERLRLRRSESESEIQKRLERIQFEYSMAEKFDHIILNDNLENAVKQIESLVFA
jgi:guanylate kinase